MAWGNGPHREPIILRAPLKTVLFREGGVSRVLKSSCIRPYTPVFRARFPCPHKKILVFRGTLNFVDDQGGEIKGGLSMIGGLQHNGASRSNELAG